MSNLYDVAILGSGPGGYVAALRAGQLGLKTAIIEKDELFGGTCLHVGCIPSKAFLYTAEILDTIREARKHGVIVDSFRLDWEQMLKRKSRVIKKLASGVAFLLNKNRVDTIRGFGAISGAGKIDVRRGDDHEVVHAKNIIIATGSEPRSLPGIEIDGVQILTNAEMLSLPERPKSLAIIGAGAIGVEFASMFHSFGTEVQLVEVLPRLVPVEDEEVSAALAAAFRKRGIQAATGTRVQLVERDQGGVHLTCALPDASVRRITAEKLLVAVGRRPRTANIGLETVGIQTERDTIVVDGHMRTTQPGVYAIGDVVGSQQLAHVASAEGIVAVETIAGKPTEPMLYERMPGATYCSPEVASVGLTEAKAREQGRDVQVGKFPFSALSKATVIGDNTGFVKIVSDGAYGEILGVHIIGPHATDLIAEACVALAHEATVESLMRVVHAHPTLSESVAEAAHAAFGEPLHA